MIGAGVSGGMMSPQVLLDRLADELAQLTQMASRLEGLILRADLDAETMVVAQGHDLLSQTIAALEGFVRTSAPAFAGCAERDLHQPLAAICLSAVAARLGGRPEAAADPGELDLF